MLKNIESVIARSEETWLSRCHSIAEIASLSLAMTRMGLFQKAPSGGLPRLRLIDFPGAFSNIVINRFDM